MRAGAPGGTSARSRDAQDAWDARREARRASRGARFAVKVVLVLAASALHLALGTSDAERAGPRDASRRALLNAADPGPDPPAPPARGDPCAASAIDASADPCAHVATHCASADAETLVDYRRFRYCDAANHPRSASLALVLLALLIFHVLSDTAETHFSPNVRALADRLRLSPTAAGVTLLALGNGAPDVFGAHAAFAAAERASARAAPESVLAGSDDAATASAARAAAVPELGAAVIAAVASAGAFVTTFVVGVVCVAAAPFRFDRDAFAFDAAAYLLGAAALFAVVRDGEVTAWEARALPMYYVAFVVVTLRRERGKTKTGTAPAPRETKTKSTPSGAAAAESESSRERGASRLESAVEELRAVEEGGAFRGGAPSPSNPSPSPSLGGAPLRPPGLPRDRSRGAPATARRSAAATVATLLAPLPTLLASLPTLLAPLLALLLRPLELARRATIPEADATRWHRAYAAANVFFCPLVAFRFATKTARELGADALATRLDPLQPPLALVASVAAGVFHARTSPESPPPLWRDAALVGGFAASVAWLGASAKELLGCVSALGGTLGVSPEVLGATALAWGNSAGDVVADAAVARAGRPGTALAACYAGPLFNAAVGLGLAFARATRRGNAVPLAVPHPGVLDALRFAVGVGALACACAKTGFAVPGGRAGKTHGWALIGAYAAFVAFESVKHSGGGG
jgi:sodium/potassium/calcium exchanger 6